MSYKYKGKTYTTHVSLAQLAKQGLQTPHINLPCHILCQGRGPASMQQL